MLTPKKTPTSADQKRMKQLFEGSLNTLNGGAVPISQQPIFRLKQRGTSALETISSKEAIAAAASSLAALWQIPSQNARRSQ